MKERIEALMLEYGAIAAVVWFGLFFATWAGAAALLQAGFEFESASGKTGLWAGSYAIAFATKPIRIILTVALCPVVAKFWRRFVPKKAEAPTEGAPAKEFGAHG